MFLEDTGVSVWLLSTVTDLILSNRLEALKEDLVEPGLNIVIGVFPSSSDLEKTCSDPENLRQTTDNGADSGLTVRELSPGLSGDPGESEDGVSGMWREA